ncbi:Flap endonuclease 1 [Capsicum annuum]|nr:Flap endonuclease 1 [Capsicum annuum]KAF3616795.1 Flap endonuclease 1 [Capsicum annuum]
MGIKGLMKLLADNAPSGMKEQKFESYFGRKIAIDASMSIYQFLIVVGRSGTEMLTNEAGETTSYVFDGKPPDLKKQELAKRYSRREDATDDLAKATETGNKEDIEKFSKRTVKVTPQHNEDCKKLLRLMGVPAVEAPSEAEAQCAVLCKAEKVYAVASEDMDSLTFGAPKFLRHLMDPSSKKIPVMEFDISKVLEELELSMDQFIDLCILCGCDYCDSIRGIGPQTALKLVRQHGSMESILENINKERYQIPDDWPYNEARRLFKEPLVVTDDEQTELKWAAPDEEVIGLVNFLVKENGFNIDRVTKAIEKIKTAKNKSSQGRLESFFKPVSTSAPIKRKIMIGCPHNFWYVDSQGTKCVLVSPIPVTKFKTLSLRSRPGVPPGVPGRLIYPSLGLRSNYSEPAQTTDKGAANKKSKAGGGKKKNKSGPVTLLLAESVVAGGSVTLLLAECLVAGQFCLFFRKKYQLVGLHFKCLVSFFSFLAQETPQPQMNELASARYSQCTGHLKPSLSLAL